MGDALVAELMAAISWGKGVLSAMYLEIAEEGVGLWRRQG